MRHLILTSEPRKASGGPVSTASSLPAENDVCQSFLENGRAFSFVINEEIGMLSAAVPRDETTVTVFGACTPLPGK